MLYKYQEFLIILSMLIYTVLRYVLCQEEIKKEIHI